MNRACRAPNSRYLISPRVISIPREVITRCYPSCAPRAHVHARPHSPIAPRMIPCSASYSRRQERRDRSEGWCINGSAVHTLSRNQREKDRAPAADLESLDLIRSIMLRKESARYISRNYIASVMQPASGRTIPFLSLAIARASGGVFFNLEGTRVVSGPRNGTPAPFAVLASSPPPRLPFDPAVPSARKIGAETKRGRASASDKIHRGDFEM